MDQDLNNLNEFLGDHDSFHFPAPTQDRTIRKSSVDFKQPQLSISPAYNPFAYKAFAIHSPSPFKQNLNFFQQDQSYSHDNHQISVSDPRRRCINHVLNFQQSPKKKSSQSNTASSLRSTNRTPQISLFSSKNREQKKNTKGLRNLSQSVYKIVLELKITTYKQVADHLVRMLNSGQFGPLEEESTKAKDEQNIKRRVYDALNVLISADVLKKNGKFVMSDQDVLSDRFKSSSKLGKKEDSQNLYQQIIKKQMIIKEKKERIEELQNKKQILNAILKRNKKKKISQKQKINFPIIGVTYLKSIPKLDHNQSFTKISLPLSNSVEIVGDMDLLVKVGIDVINQNIQQVIQQVSEQDIQIQQPKRRSKVQTTSNINNNAIGSQTRNKTRVLYSL